MPIGSPAAPARAIGGPRPAAPGFAYLGLLVAVAVLGVAAAGTVSLGALASRQDAERQLLAIGGEFELALRSYAAASPPAQAGIGPRALEDLLKDPRSAGLKRHLRRIRPDPLTGTSDWGLLLARDGSILGVYSLAQGRPQKLAGFGPAQAHFERAERYADWVFTANPERLPARPAAWHGPAPEALRPPSAPPLPVATDIRPLHPSQRRSPRWSNNSSPGIWSRNARSAPERWPATAMR